MGAALCRGCPTWSLIPFPPELCWHFIVNTENNGKGTAAEGILQALHIHCTPEPEKTELDPQTSCTDSVYQSMCGCLGAAPAAEGSSWVRTFFLHVWEPGRVEGFLNIFCTRVHCHMWSLWSDAESSLAEKSWGWSEPKSIRAKLFTQVCSNHSELWLGGYCQDHN